MDFTWSQAQLDYRREAKKFLLREMPSDWQENYALGIASPEQAAFGRRLCAKLAAEGLLIQHWPKAYGGEDAEPWVQFILSEEMWAWNEPRGPQYMNVNFIAYAIMRYGTDEQKAQHLAKIAEGDVIWCQGFSEAQAGTDLAALQAIATPTATGYRINGAKQPITYARVADYCFLLARTGPERKNITALMVPMTTPGITVTPIPGLCMDGHMNEILFDDVEVPESARLGEEGEGFDVALFALSYERVGTPRYQFGRYALDAAVAQLKREGRFSDPLIRAAAGRLVAKLEAGRLLTYAVIDERVKERVPTVISNIQRVTASVAILELMDFLIEYVPDCLAGGDRYLNFFYRSMISQTMAAGTYELQLNLIAQRGLGLPRSH